MILYSGLTLIAFTYVNSDRSVCEVTVSVLTICNFETHKECAHTPSLFLLRHTIIKDDAE